MRPIRDIMAIRYFHGYIIFISLVEIFSFTAFAPQEWKFLFHSCGAARAASQNPKGSKAVKN